MMNVKLISHSPINEDQKLKVIRTIERHMSRGHMRSYLESKKIPGRAKLYQNLRWNKPTNFWRLPEAERSTLREFGEIQVEAALIDLAKKIDFDDLLGYYCSAVDLNSMYWYFERLSFNFNIVVELRNKYTLTPVGQQDEPEVATDQFISFSRPSNT